MTSASPSPAERRSGRPRVSWWRELALLAALYGVYLLARALVGVQPDPALDRGQWLLDLEAAVWLDLERPLNSALHAGPLLAVLADYVYASLHYVLTPLVLVWLAVRHRSGSARAATPCSSPPPLDLSASGCSRPLRHGCSRAAASSTRWPCSAAGAGGARPRALRLAWKG